MTKTMIAQAGSVKLLGSLIPLAAVTLNGLPGILIGSALALTLCQWIMALIGPLIRKHASTLRFYQYISSGIHHAGCAGPTLNGRKSDILCIIARLDQQLRRNHAPRFVKIKTQLFVHRASFILK
jgi:hypothetical protein